jgi:hypothetical protein
MEAVLAVYPRHNLMVEKKNSRAMLLVFGLLPTGGIWPFLLPNRMLN